MLKKPLSLYIHYPFCKSKCPYCDFNSHVSNQIDYKSFLKAYLQELDYFASKLKNRQIKTIFFGGGTPSLMPAYFVDEILDKVSSLWQISTNCEISLEANPTSFEANKFKDFKKAGINRLSIGIQALNDTDLKFLGRNHSAKEAINTINSASKIFDNYSFDLIYARPEQSLKNWIEELEMAISLSANHLSIYQLTIEKGTEFYKRYLNKEFFLPNEDLAANLYHTTNKITTNHGLNCYEVSNYAKENYQCQHNLTYWQSGDYLGIGAGSHSRVYLDNEKDRKEIMMFNQPLKWLDKIKSEGNAIQKIVKIDQLELLEEITLMGLRLVNGIDNEVFLRHFNKNINQIFDFNKLSFLIEQDFIFIDSKNIKITKKGFILSNSIISKVIDSINSSIFQ